MCKHLYTNMINAKNVFVVFLWVYLRMYSLKVTALKLCPSYSRHKSVHPVNAVILLNGTLVNFVPSNAMIFLFLTEIYVRDINIFRV